MAIVKRVEPGLVEPCLATNNHYAAGTVSQDEMFYLNKDLKNVRDYILKEKNFDDESDDAPRLTEMMKSPMRRYGSVGSLMPESSHHPMQHNWHMGPMQPMGPYFFPQHADLGDTGYPQYPYEQYHGHPPPHGYYPYHPPDMRHSRHHQPSYKGKID